MRLQLLLLCPLLLFAACKPEKVTPCDDFKGAYSFLQKQVTAKLVSPATAVFPVAPDDRFASSDVIIAKKEGCAFGISSHVDSQNSFGALLRTNFSADVKYDQATNRWFILRLLIAPN